MRLRPRKKTIHVEVINASSPRPLYVGDEWLVGGDSFTLHTDMAVPVTVPTHAEPEIVGFLFHGKFHPASRD